MTTSTKQRTRHDQQPVLRRGAWSRRSAASSGSTASTSSCTPARSSRSSATTAPASRRSSSACRGPHARRRRDPRRRRAGRVQAARRTRARPASRPSTRPSPSPRARHREQPLPRPRGTAPGFLGSVLRMLDSAGMRGRAQSRSRTLGITTLQDMTQAVETLSGGQRQAVAVARAAAFGSKVVILDEPTAALGVRETARCCSWSGPARPGPAGHHHQPRHAGRSSRSPTASTSSGSGGAPRSSRPSAHAGRGGRHHDRRHRAA